MKITLLNQKITFQRTKVVTDNIGNHKNEWENYYSCHAAVSGENGKETFSAGTTADNSDVSFSVRYCAALTAVTADKFRIIFHDEIYNIIGINHMNLQNKTLKFKCEKVKR